MRGRASCVPNGTQHGQHRHILPVRCTDPVLGLGMDVTMLPSSSSSTPCRRGIPCRSSRRHSRCRARASCNSAQLVHLSTHQSSLSEDPQDLTTSGASASTQLGSLSPPWWSHSNTTSQADGPVAPSNVIDQGHELHPVEPHLPLQHTLQPGADKQQLSHGSADLTLDQPPLQPVQMQPEQEQLARKLSTRLKYCSNWQQVVSVLHAYARLRGSLPNTVLDADLHSAGGMPDPTYLVQPLNHRHLVVLWYTLARIVNLGDEEHVGVFRARSNSSSAPPQSTQPISSPQHASDEQLSVRDAESALDDVPATSSRSGAPLSRIEVVALRRLLTKLEQASLAGMATHTWAPTDAVSAMWAMAQVGYRPSNRWLPTWVQFTHDSIPHLGARHLANALWGLATAGLNPGPSWLQRASQHAVHLSTQHQFTAPAYASVLWSLARLVNSTQLPVPAAPPTQQQSGSPGHGTVLFSSSQLLTYLTHTLQHVPDMEPHHISMLLWSVGSLASTRHACVRPLTCGGAVEQQQGATHEQDSSRQSNGTDTSQQHVLPTHLTHANPWRTEPRQQQLASSWEAAWKAAPPGDAALPSSPAQQPGLSHTATQPAAVPPPAPPTSCSDQAQLQYCVDCLWHAAMHWGAQCLGPQGTANALWSAAHLYGPLGRAPQVPGSPASSTCTPTARAAVHRLVEGSLAVLPHMSAQQLYNSAWAVATMQVVPSQAWVASLMSSSRTQLAQAELQSLTGLVWACCRLRVKPGPAWMAALIRAVETRYSALCPASLPILLWSLSYLGYHPGLVWIKGLTARTLNLLPHMSPQGLAMSVHALAKLRLPAHPAWGAQLEACIHHSVAHTLAAHSRRSGKRPSAQRAVAAVAEEWGQTGSVSVQLIRPSELSASLQGMARLGMQPSVELLEAAEQLLGAWVAQSGQEAAGKLQLRQLAGCLFGLVRLGHQVSEDFLHAATAAVIQMSHAMARESDGSEQRRLLAVDVTQACWALAMMGHTPSHSQLADLSLITHQLLPSMMHMELAQCTWALQRLGLTHPDPAWINTLLSVSEPQLQQLARASHAAGAHDAVSAHQQPAALPPLTGSPLLSVATLLRALVMWGCTCADVSSPAARAGKVHVSSRWLEAASTLVEVEAAQRLATCKGPLPAADQLSAGTVPSSSHDRWSADGAAGPDSHAVSASGSQEHWQKEESTDSVLHHEDDSPASSLDEGASDSSWSSSNGVVTSAARLQRPARSSTSPSPGPAAHQPAGAPQPYLEASAALQQPSAGLLLCSRAAPYAQEQARMSALSVSEVQVSKKTARRRLWHVHRMHVLQHAKVVQASRRALRQLAGQHTVLGVGMRLDAGSGSASSKDQLCASGPAPPLDSTTQGHVMRDASRAAVHADGSTSSCDLSDEQYQQYDGLYAEQDLRFIPW